jgi:hypothetical protein
MAAKSEKKIRSLAQARAIRASRYAKARAGESATGRPQGKSLYALKIQRKIGRGRVDPRWQWWLERAT